MIYAKQLAKSIIPIKSIQLKDMTKEQLKIIILTREISFNNVQRELNNMRKDIFDVSRIDLALTYTQEEIINTCIVQAKELKKFRTVFGKEGYRRNVETRFKAMRIAEEKRKRKEIKDRQFP